METKEVKCKESGDVMLIKACRFNPEIHEDVKEVKKKVVKKAKKK